MFHLCSIRGSDFVSDFVLRISDLVGVFLRIDIGELIGPDGFRSGYRRACRFGGGNLFKKIGDIVGIHSLSVFVGPGFFRRPLPELNAELETGDG